MNPVCRVHGGHCRDDDVSSALAVTMMRGEPSLPTTVANEGMGSGTDSLRVLSVLAQPHLPLTSCHMLDEIGLKVRAALKKGTGQYAWVLVRMFWKFGCAQAPALPPLNHHPQSTAGGPSHSAEKEGEPVATVLPIQQTPSLAKCHPPLSPRLCPA